MIDKENILASVCYTELVYGRINKKLNTTFTKEQIEVIILKMLRETDQTFYTKTGKNFYVLSPENNIRITINSNTFRVITVDRIAKR
jgi:hypothetical protein